MNAVKSVSSGDFQSQVLDASHKQAVLVDFWAPWCGPCQALGPTLEKAAGEFAGRVTVLKLNTDEEGQIASQYGIRSIPAVKLFRDGKVAAEFVGAQPLSAVRQFLTQHLPAAESAAPAPEQPWTKAIALARKGDLDAAQTLLDALDPTQQSDDAVKAARAVLHFARILQAPDDTDVVQSARVRAARNLLAQQFASGFDDLLQVMQRNRRFGVGQGREDMLQAFALAPATDPSVLAARRKLAALLN